MLNICIFAENANHGACIKPFGPVSKL